MVPTTMFPIPREIKRWSDMPRRKMEKFRVGLIWPVSEAESHFGRVKIRALVHHKQSQWFPEDIRRRRRNLSFRFEEGRETMTNGVVPGCLFMF